MAGEWIHLLPLHIAFHFRTMAFRPSFTVESSPCMAVSAATTRVWRGRRVAVQDILRGTMGHQIHTGSYNTTNTYPLGSFAMDTEKAVPCWRTARRW